MRIISNEELLESLDQHFLRGNAGLTLTQFKAHASRDSCAQCDEITRAVAEIGRGEIPVNAK